MATAPNRPLAPGERAPDFTLAAVNRKGLVSLADYRGRNPALVVILRGLHCPFCRRHIAQLGAARPAFDAAGIVVVAAVITDVERARLYFRAHPAPIAVCADPERVCHRAFGVPRIQLVTSETPTPTADGTVVRFPREAFLGLRLNPTGELPEPMSPLEGSAILNEFDGFRPTEADERIKTEHRTQLVGHFLVDRDGVVRWRHIEAEGGMADVLKLPDVKDLLGAARRLARPV